MPKKTTESTEKLLNSDDDDESSETSDSCTYVTLLYYFLCFALWLTLYFLFIELQFGTVFLISSGLAAICVNTRTGPKDENEISAYSVFNPNCESIDGTLKAEQFEREIRFGATSVR